MSSAPPVLAGYRGLRAELLLELKKAQPLSARALATRFGLTAQALRRHLKTLEEDGVVRYRREVRGVGGPVFAYSLTPQGEALFPKDYLGALAEALEVVHEEQGDAGVARIFERRWQVIAGQIRPQLEGLDMAERARRLGELLSTHGYMASVTTNEGGSEVEIREHNCAMRAVAERFPQACRAEAAFIADMLGGEVERVSHVLDGCAACEYVVRIERRVPAVPAPSQEHP
jgi:DeoR family suf operon transcriptional repressor